jgi:hypothetical protein
MVCLMVFSLGRPKWSVSWCSPDATAPRRKAAAAGDHESPRNRKVAPACGVRAGGTACSVRRRQKVCLFAGPVFLPARLFSSSKHGPSAPCTPPSSSPLTSPSSSGPSKTAPPPQAPRSRPSHPSLDQRSVGFPVRVTPHSNCVPPLSLQAKQHPPTITISPVTISPAPHPEPHNASHSSHQSCQPCASHPLKPTHMQPSAPPASHHPRTSFPLHQLPAHTAATR